MQMVSRFMEWNGMDWNGHGGSDGLHAYMHSLDYDVNDMQGLTEKSSLPCFCFGHSTGGAIILKLGARMLHIQKRMLPISVFLLQRDVEYLRNHEYLRKRISAAFNNFAEST